MPNTNKEQSCLDIDAELLKHSEYCYGIFDNNTTFRRWKRYLEQDCIDPYKEEKRCIANRIYKEMKNKEEEQIMNKYIITTEDGNAIFASTMDKAKELASLAAISENREAYIYELKLTAGIVKPKVEFKEV
jgi:hypothetical protein